MKTIRTEPHDSGAEGDERNRTAVTAPSTDVAYGPRVLTLDEQRSLIAVWEAAQEVWKYSYSRGGETDLLVPRPEMLALGRALDARGGAR